MKYSHQLFARQGLAPKAFRGLLEKFNNPQLQVATILVGGTNGKGSTASALACLLSKSGFKTGLLTSPHLLSVRERMAIDGSYIDAATFEELEQIIDEKTQPLQLNFFQYLTLLAFIYFSRQEVDVAVLEVGLGGRLDPTNVAEPMISAITNVDWDHTDTLGNTLEAILHEKLPISRRERPLILSEEKDALVKLAEKWCDQQNTHLILKHRDYGIEEKAEVKEFWYKNIWEPLATVNEPLFLTDNKATAAAILYQLFDLGFLKKSPPLKQTLDSLRLLGRFLTVDNLTIDMAHNDAGFKRLAGSAPASFELILALPENRPALPTDPGLHLLINKADKVWCPEMQTLDSAHKKPYFLSPQKLKQELDLGDKAHIVDTLDKAIEQTKGRKALVCGSSRIAGEAMQILSVDTLQSSLY